MGAGRLRMKIHTYLFTFFGRYIFFIAAHSFLIILLFPDDLINKHTQRTTFDLP